MSNNKRNNDKFIHPSEEVSGTFECYFLIDLPSEHQVWFFVHISDGPRIVIHNYDDEDGLQWLGHRTPFTIQFGKRGIKV